VGLNLIQAMSGIGYTFKRGDILLVYCHLDYEFDADYLLRDLTISCPALGTRLKS
jgi:hypothetical protein